MKKKIFIGEIDICGQIGDFKKGYESLGYKVFTLVKNRTKASYEDIKYSFVLHSLYPFNLLQTSNKLKIFLRKIYSLFFVNPVYYSVWIWAILNFNTFHFVWITEKKWKFILYLLKKLNKKIIVSYVGSDTKWHPTYMQESEILGLEHAPSELLMRNALEQNITIEEKLQTIRIGEKYANVINSVPDQAQLALRPYFNFYIPVDFNSIKFNIPKNIKPVVSIGLTRTKGGGKNSQTLIDMITDFKKNTEIQFEFIVIQNKQHKEVIKILSYSDIFIYSPYTKGAGKFGMEALASGTVLLTGYDKDYLKLPPNPPIVNITSENLLEKLEYYLINTQERKILAKNGRKWVEKYADPTWICNKIINNLNNPDTKPDYYPEFFRHHATFNSKWDSPDSIEICNKWTNFVKNYTWYKKYIKPGEREGLKF